MKIRALYLALLCAASAHGAVEVDIEAFGKSLGGWDARKGKAAEYEVSEAGYRTYRPEVSPSPDGGIFISVRIDHRRGFMASDDHASLELSFAPDGSLVSAQSSLALQGRTISSDLIKGGASASTSVAAPGIDRAVKVGTDLVADLSSKLLREKIVEPGRVSFPAAIRHNYNMLYRAVRLKTEKPVEVAGAATTPPPSATTTTPLKPEGPGSLLVPSKGMGTPPAGTPPAHPGKTPAPPAAGSSTTTTTTTTSTAAPAAAGAATGAVGAPQASTTDAGKKKEPNLEIKPYNPSGNTTTPIPDKKDQSLLRTYGGDMLKITRDVVRAEVK